MSAIRTTVEFARDFRQSYQIKREFPELNRVALGLLVATSMSHVRKNTSIIEGHALPSNGPAIVVGNHRAEDDNYKMTAVAVRTGRFIRPILKKGLVVKGFSESQAYLRSIEAEESLRYKAVMAFVLRGVGAVPVDREHLDVNLFMRQTRQILKSSQMLGLFIQPHRYEDGSLRYLQQGAAILSMRHPNIPVFPFTSSKFPDGTDRLTIHKPFTYREKVQENKDRRLTPEELTVMIADMIAEGLPEEPKNHWLNEGRDLEIKRLAASRK